MTLVAYILCVSSHDHFASGSDYVMPAVNHYYSRLWLMRLTTLLSLIAINLGCLGASGLAQQPSKPSAKAAPPKEGPEGYLRLPVDDAQKKNQLEVNKILRERKFEAGQKELLVDFYERFNLARWTDPENYTLLPAFRKKLRNDLLTVGYGPVHDRLNNLTFEILRKLAQDNYHPAVRFNAMLMIGDLNAVEPGGGTKPAVPLPQAFEFMLATLEDPDQVDTVKVASLIGIIRHARLEVANTQARDRAVAAMLRIAVSKRPPKRSPDGHAWMRMQAIDALAALGGGSAQADVVKALLGIIAEKDARFATRCAAATALTQVKLVEAASSDLSQAPAALGRLALDIWAAEQARQEKQEEEQIAIYSKSGEEIFILRRGLQFRFHAVLEGLEAVEAVTAAPQKTLAGDLQKQIRNMLRLLADKAMDDEELIEKLDEKMQRFAETLGAPSRKPEVAVDDR